jgi:hypothetical protein
LHNRHRIRGRNGPTCGNLHQGRSRHRAVFRLRPDSPRQRASIRVGFAVLDPWQDRLDWCWLRGVHHCRRSCRKWHRISRNPFRGGRPAHFDHLTCRRPDWLRNIGPQSEDSLDPHRALHRRPWERARAYLGQLRHPPVDTRCTLHRNRFVPMDEIGAVSRCNRPPHLFLVRRKVRPRCAKQDATRRRSSYPLGVDKQPTRRIGEPPPFSIRRPHFNGPIYNLHRRRVAPVYDTRCPGHHIRHTRRRCAPSIGDQRLSIFNHIAKFGTAFICLDHRPIRHTGLLRLRKTRPIPITNLDLILSLAITRQRPEHSRKALSRHRSRHNRPRGHPRTGRK